MHEPSGRCRPCLLYTSYMMLPGRILDEQEQYFFYCSCLAAANGCPVTVRTFDFGSDRTVADANQGPQSSKLGLRGIRNSLCQPQQFQTCLLYTSCSRCAAAPRPLHRTAWQCRYPPGRSSWPAAQRARRPAFHPAGCAAASSPRPRAGAGRCWPPPAGGRRRPGQGCSGRCLLYTSRGRRQSGPAVLQAWPARHPQQPAPAPAVPDLSLIHIL